MAVQRPTRIAVIGAGAAGLAQAKQLLDAFQGLNVELVIYDARNDVGGVWLEDPEAGDYAVKSDSTTPTIRILPSSAGVLPSPIYPGLRTNLPKQLMAYRDTPFEDDIPLFPRAHHVEDYLRKYADAHRLRQYIRFSTTVTRVYKPNADSAQWVVESRRNGSGGEGVEEVFDFVSVTNGHYEKASIPDIPGLSGFTGQIMHSRWYRRPEYFIGKKVLVVGSFASGSDIARELASVNLPSEVVPESMTAFKTSRPADVHKESDGEDSEIDATIDDEKRIRVYQSSSQTPNMFTSGLAADEGDDARPWLRLIEQRPLIEKINSEEGNSTIRFKDGTTLTGIDVIIFATGYLYYYSFFKQTDAPWNRPEAQLLDLPIVEGDVVGEGQADVGGMQGLGMRHMDELMIFLENDRSMALIGLPYQVVPFPLFEIQSHLVSLLWANKLPNFPDHPTIPARSTADPLPTPPETPRTSTTPSSANPSPKDNAAVPKGIKEKRYTELVRGDYVFGFPYEFHYENYVLGLTAEADGGKEGGWGEVEAFRWDFRRQKDLRFQTIGY